MLLVAINQFVARNTGDTKLAAELRNTLTLKVTRDKTHFLIHLMTLLPRHSSSPYAKKM